MLLQIHYTNLFKAIARGVNTYREDIKAILEERYPIVVSDVQLLQDVDDQVFLITSQRGEKYKFKLIHAPSEKREKQLEEIARWVGFLNSSFSVSISLIFLSREFGECNFLDRIYENTYSI